MVGAGIYRPKHEPSDQTDLNGWRRCNLGGGGEPTFEGGADRWGPQASRPAGTHPLLRWVISWSVLEPSGVVFAVNKRD